VTVAVLFARRDSVYKTLPGCDVYDIDRDARTWPGGCPVIAHPPCRAWGGLRHFARPRPDEKALALFAVDQVRRNGGVLEHPTASTLWAAAGLPRPGGTHRDSFGGWSLQVLQFWWGHRANKSTWLYIVGCEPANLPDFPLILGKASCVVERIPKWEREATPPKFAEWLFKLAQKCEVNHGTTHFHPVAEPDSVPFFPLPSLVENFSHLCAKTREEVLSPGPYVIPGLSAPGALSAQ
jgi:hypothetical protein